MKFYLFWVKANILKMFEFNKIKKYFFLFGKFFILFILQRFISLKFFILFLLIQLRIISFKPFIYNVNILLTNVKSILNYYFINTYIICNNRVHWLCSLTQWLVNHCLCDVFMFMEIHLVGFKNDFLIFFWNC